MRLNGSFVAIDGASAIPSPTTWQTAWDSQDFAVIKQWYQQYTGLTNPSQVPAQAEGRIYSSSDGQVIEDRNVAIYDQSTEAAITVNHQNVTIRNCKVYADERSAAIRINSSNGRVENCEIDGSLTNYGTGRDDANFGNTGILLYGVGGEVYRNWIYNCRSACRVAPSGQVTENFIEKLHQHAPNVSSSSISYSNINASPSAQSNRNLTEVGSSAAMTTYSQTAAAKNYLNEYNVMATKYAMQDDDFTTEQYSYAVYGGYTGDFKEGIENIRIENNRFVGAFAYDHYPGGGTNGAVNVSKPGCTFIGNRFLGGGADLPSNSNV